MTLVFFACRVIFFPVVYYLYSVEHGKYHYKSFTRFKLIDSNNDRLLYLGFCGIFRMQKSYLIIFNSIIFSGASMFDTITKHVPPICSISMLVLFLPQLYWFGIMLKGGLKVICGKDTTKDD